MSNHTSLDQIKVSLDFGAATIPVGRLASRDNKVYFEYDSSFLNLDLNISPFKLPLEPGLSSFDSFLFEGVPGVFNDSLPDGWGRLLLDRILRGKNLLPSEFSSLDRLAYVGKAGLGALIYEPDQSEENNNHTIGLDELADQTKAVLDGEAEDVLQELMNLNGSSAGARPKALIGIEKSRKHLIHGSHTLPDRYEHWLVKFANAYDGPDAGAIEYVYGLMAIEAGVEMADIHLFPAKKGAGYFATKRFDRNKGKRLHMHTASGLLHSDFRTPSLDYENLLALTEVLTKDVREVAKMFHLSVFNVLSHNRDDHGKNFSFLMNDQGEWKLSPAYDLTFSSGPRGEQSTMVLGEGKKPTVDHLIKLGTNAKIDKKHVHEIIEKTRNALRQWTRLAKDYGVSQSSIKLIEDRISS
ncbi:MAG: type II toxin-antitoxin system HipA family toxin [Cyclobacteriaceae bacterium]